MRKVDLTMTENKNYKIIKKLVDTQGNKKRASLEIDCSIRHVNRMIQGYKDQGKVYFVHGNRGKKPAHAIPDDRKKAIVDLYRTKYWDANFTHFSELLSKFETISVSSNTVHALLSENSILSPKARKSTKKKMKKLLEEKRDQAISKNEADKIHAQIVEVENAHPRRPRSANFGEMIQMDASVHVWFGNQKTHLHLAIDDCTGMIVGAYFDTQETLNGYYHVLHQILKDYGIPYMFYTDRRTVFEYKQKKSPSFENDTFTQFGYACKQLGITIKTTSVPQAKGRVERVFQTLQSRLPLELRLAGITTIEQANIFLNTYIKEYNDKFALPVNHTKSVFVTQPNDEKINLILAVISERKIDCGHCIRFGNTFYKPFNANGIPVYYHKGISCLVIKAFDGNLFGCIDERVYALEEVPKHETVSRNFDWVKSPDSPKKRYIPPMSHPWKRSAFSKFVKSQKHHHDQPFEEAAYSQAISAKYNIYAAKAY